jgi:hypothetical protein
VTRIARLHEHLAGQPGAARAAAHLHQLREQPLARAEIVREQRGVGIQHADQRDALEVVPFAIICVPTRMSTSPACTLENSACAALAARAVRVDAQHARARHGLGERLLDALRAAAERCDVDVAAVGHERGMRASQPQ